MLRRTQSLRKADLPVDDEAEFRAADELPPATKLERPNLEALRAEVQKSLASQSESGDVIRSGGGFSFNLKHARLLLVVVALIAGGLAAWLATRHEAPPPAVAATPEVTAPPMTQVLVAKGPIAIGQRLSADLLQWEDWPEASIRPDFVTNVSTPEAMTSMSESVARLQIFAGEPILPQKLVQAGSGYLSAVLDTGKRGVSVSVTAEAASGGFVVPGDHVDVVLTHASNTAQVSETILRNVRVLAINTNLGSGADASTPDPSTEAFANQAIATLELDPSQAEVIINATVIGRLTLVLRPAVETAAIANAQQAAANQAIRLSSRFWAQ